ncbi:ParB N-terminal domain-containing protein [Salinimicrobium oceani]|uniref:ParB N-terminal domain-containing protein n=1 Tax=Salinimicrobium oceani TaxID=2722702 RepID=A0ABX1CZ79_9FLAO|nr:ParB N-terminal domain-containing protein [Salinimicrobium oceani]NJW53562.1 ParB N-terminal domain-containing protein [Salinimicrobium oceani]
MISVKKFSSVKKRDLPSRYQDHYSTIEKTISSGLYLEDKEVQKIIDALINQVNNEIRAKEPKKKNQVKIKGSESDGSVLSYPISRIKTDEKRFQNRSRLNENTVNNIVDNYSPTQLDPLIVWKDPKTGETFLLAGHHRLEALKRMKKSKGPVKFANKDFPTEKDAIKYARQLSNANRTLEQPHERAKIYREMRLAGESKKEIEKAAQIEGKNKSYILNLSYLNPNGTVAEGLTRFEGATDKDSSAKVERIADWIGQARRQNNKLTNAHESEMYKFLNDAAQSKRVTSKADFLQKVSSITGDMFYNYEDPLNLAKFKYQTEGEKVYDAEVEELKEAIAARQDSIDEIKQRFVNPNSKNYISPDAKDYQQAKNIADEKISRYNVEIQELQKLLQELYQNKGKYVNAGSNQIGLFGAWKKKQKSRSTGLEMPAADPSDYYPAAPISKPVKQPNGAKNLADAMNLDNPSEIFPIAGEIGRFLGQVERKPVHSVVTTLDAEQGAGKTRFLFQVMNEMAAAGLNCLFISLEEHPTSNLFKDKVRQYINSDNLTRISVLDEVDSWGKISPNINRADVIFIDSFQKLPPNLDLDQDIRKAFHGKWFFVIYQQTGTKTMRGGSRAAFDGDQILKIEKNDDYRENLLYANKNRYNDAPDLKLNIFTGKLVGNSYEEVEEFETMNTPLAHISSGQLIAIPIL